MFNLSEQSSVPSEKRSITQYISPDHSTIPIKKFFSSQIVLKRLLHEGEANSSNWVQNAPIEMEDHLINQELLRQKREGSILEQR